METNIYALTDTHQECRNLCRIFSEILRDNDSKLPFLLLDGGDLFKGIYDKDLCVSTYLKFKKLLPNSLFFLTIGNNDFGFNEKDFEYFKNTVKIFENSGIKIVCANMKSLETGDYCDFIKRYEIANINGKKFLITGFCLNTSIIKNFGYEFESAPECFVKLIKQEVKEDYDYIIVLNHHWVDYSKKLKDYAKQNGINIDLIIGGHEHSKKEADYLNNIFYPHAFARSYYKFGFDEKITNVQEFACSGVDILPEFEYDLLNYEEKTELYKPLCKRVLNLFKYYSEPCALGTFISDNMCRVAKTDIAFHSTGFTMYPLKTEDSDVITKYDFEKVICAPTPIVKIDINIAQLKQVFENATLNRMYKNNGNARFVQCSQNIEITGKGDKINNTYKIIQIKINGEKLLDEYQNPIDTRIYTCATDKFIASGEQGFEVLKNIPYKIVYDEFGAEIPINKLLYNSLLLAQEKYPPNSEYPTFSLTDL